MQKYSQRLIVSGWIPFIFLSSASVITTFIWYFNSVDVRWWWPIILVVSSFFNIICTGCWYLISIKYPINIRSSLFINSIVVFLMIASALAYYILWPTIDWNDVNSWIRSLNFIEKILFQSDIDMLILYLLWPILAYIVWKWSNKNQ